MISITEFLKDISNLDDIEKVEGCLLSLEQRYDGIKEGLEKQECVATEDILLLLKIRRNIDHIQAYYRFKLEEEKSCQK